MEQKSQTSLRQLEILREIEKRLTGTGVRTRLVAPALELRLPDFVIGLKFNIDAKGYLLVTTVGGGASLRQFIFKPPYEITSPEFDPEPIIQRALSIADEFSILESRLYRAAFQTFHPIPETVAPAI